MNLPDQDPMAHMRNQFDLDRQGFFQDPDRFRGPPPRWGDGGGFFRVRKKRKTF